MAGSRVLVVFHSRSGTTRRIARAIADSLEADVEEIIDLKTRAGLFGYLGAGRDAIHRRCTPIGDPARDPADYELVIVGSPVWVGRMSSPVRSYLDRNRGRFKAAGFFCTCGGRNNDTALFADMADIAGCTPCAVLVVTDAEEAKGVEWEKVREFEDAVAGRATDTAALRRTA